MSGIFVLYINKVKFYANREVLLKFFYLFSATFLSSMSIFLFFVLKNSECTSNTKAFFDTINKTEIVYIIFFNIFYLPVPSSFL